MSIERSTQVIRPIDLSASPNEDPTREYTLFIDKIITAVNEPSELLQLIQDLISKIFENQASLSKGQREYYLKIALRIAQEKMPCGHDKAEAAALLASQIDFLKINY